MVTGDPPLGVTTTGMVFKPTAMASEPEAEPEVTAVPFTVTLAPAVVTVGVTVMDET